jgi:hypothetical protein
MGETVTLQAVRIGPRQGFKLVAANGWTASFATRPSAMAFARQCMFVLRTSILDPEATVNQFSGGSPPDEVR